jgi:cysteine-rich repeat protein
MARRQIQTRILLCALVLLGGAACGSCDNGDECATVAECAAEAPACRTAVACDAGTCVFKDAAEETALPDPTPGDCKALVCNGHGAVKIVPSVADIEDDGKACTADVCIGSVPTHKPLAYISCYTGPAETEGVGVCKPGLQACDAEGMPTGDCVGQALPGAESCASLFDEDCDGAANEEGPGCSCTPGTLKPCYTGPAATSDVGICHTGMAACDADGFGYGACQDEAKPGAEVCDAAETDEDCDGHVNEDGANCDCGDGVLSVGEECDDGNQEDTDACTSLCQAAACGDGDVQPASGEECDDGNESDADRCASCAIQEAVMVATGNNHTCAIRNEGSVKCWGGNGSGQLGLGDTFPRGDLPGEMGDNLSPVNLGFGRTAVALAAGYGHVCALLDNDRLKCWGANLYGELGLGNTIQRGDAPGEMGDNLPFVDLGAGAKVVAVSSWYRHSCALLDGGAVKCWGYNDAGRLGLGDMDHRGDDLKEVGDNLPAVDLGNGAIAVAIAVGAAHACAILSDATLKCWGHNLYAQLGQGDMNHRGDMPGEMGDELLPVSFTSGKTVKAVAAGHLHTCVLLNDDTVRCWGYNDSGQLGLGDKNHRGDNPNEMGVNLPPVDLGTGKKAIAIAAGNRHTCAILEGGSVKCWGYNVVGQLGLESTSQLGDEPNEMGDKLPYVDLGAGKTALAIAAGWDHTCALLNDGSVKCWGYNANGQLGLGDPLPRGGLLGDMGEGLPIAKLFSPVW